MDMLIRISYLRHHDECNCKQGGKVSISRLNTHKKEEVTTLSDVSESLQESVGVVAENDTIQELNVIDNTYKG